VTSGGGEDVAVQEAPDKYSADMDKPMEDTSKPTGVPHAVGGLLLAIAGGFFLAQAGGSDRETFLFFGYMLIAVGFLGMLVGGVALGVQLARR
jgi:hypothetical protein